MQVVSGTPGRVVDVLKRSYLMSGSIFLFVLDEADEMLSVGLSYQVYEIFRHMSSEV